MFWYSLSFLLNQVLITFVLKGNTNALKRISSNLLWLESNIFSCSRVYTTYYAHPHPPKANLRCFGSHTTMLLGSRN